MVVDGEGELTLSPVDEFSLPYPWLFLQDVGYPEFLNIRPYMSQSSGEPVMYGLYAVLVHSGHGCHAGHYYCYVKVSAPACGRACVTWRCPLVQVQAWPPWKVALFVVVFRACCCFGEWRAKMSLKPIPLGALGSLPLDGTPEGLPAGPNAGALVEAQEGCVLVGDAVLLRPEIPFRGESSHLLGQQEGTGIQSTLRSHTQSQTSIRHFNVKSLLVH